MQSILLVATAAPDIDSHGGSQRTRAIWSALNKLAATDLFLLGLDATDLGARVQTLEDAFNLVGASRRMERVERLFGKIRNRWLWRLLNRLAWRVGYEKLAYGVDPKASGALKAQLDAKQYDLVVALHLNTACRGGLLGYHPLIVDVDDYGPDDTASSIQTLGRWSFLERWLLTRRLKRQRQLWPQLLAQVDGLWVSNLENRQEPGLERAEWVPNLPGICSASSVMRPAQGTSNGKNVLMVGSLGRPQMQQGFEWFIREVWPQVFKSCPDACLRVVGGGAPAHLKERWQTLPGVQLEGFVDDIVPFYQSASLVVCPIFQGAGTSIKLIEALGFSRPVVTTPFGLRGYRGVLKAGEHVEVAEPPLDFVKACLNLLNDELRASQLGRSGAEAVAETFTDESLRRNIQTSVLETLEGAKSEI